MAWNKWWRWLVCDKQGRVVIFQRPNLPLYVWLGSILVPLLPISSNALQVAALSIGTVAILYWALLELFKGESRFRRLLGLVVTVCVSCSAAFALLIILLGFAP